ncbi:putative lipoprotein [Serratia plymuthica A30]|nr:putative lipoprotein [Serratia plymuthica A30]
MKHHFNFYEKAGFIFSGGMFSALALCSSKTIKFTRSLKLKFKKYLIF